MGSPKHLWTSWTDTTNFRDSPLPLFHHAPGTGELSPETRRTGFPWEQVPFHGKRGAIYPDEPLQRPAKLRRNRELLLLEAEAEDGLFMLVWSYSPSPSLVLINWPHEQTVGSTLRSADCCHSTCCCGALASG